MRDTYVNACDSDARQNSNSIANVFWWWWWRRRRLGWSEVGGGNVLRNAPHGKVALLRHSVNSHSHSHSQSQLQLVTARLVKQVGKDIDRASASSKIIPKVVWLCELHYGALALTIYHFQERKKERKKKRNDQKKHNLMYGLSSLYHSTWGFFRVVLLHFYCIVLYIGCVVFCFRCLSCKTKIYSPSYWHFCFYWSNFGNHKIVKVMLYEFIGILIWNQCYLLAFLCTKLTRRIFLKKCINIFMIELYSNICFIFNMIKITKIKIQYKSYKADMYLIYIL